MKTHILAPTKTSAAGSTASATSRPALWPTRSGSMIYGRPGLGKTQFSMRYAIENNAVYLSALKASSPKSFVIELLRAVRAVYEPQNAEPIRGTRAILFRELLTPSTSTPPKPTSPLSSWTKWTTSSITATRISSACSAILRTTP